MVCVKKWFKVGLFSAPYRSREKLILYPHFRRLNQVNVIGLGHVSRLILVLFSSPHMNGESEHIYTLFRLECWIWAIRLKSRRSLRFLEQVDVIEAGLFVSPYLKNYWSQNHQACIATCIDGVSDDTYALDLFET